MQPAPHAHNHLRRVHRIGLAGAPAAKPRGLLGDVVDGVVDGVVDPLVSVVDNVLPGGNSQPTTTAAPPQGTTAPPAGTVVTSNSPGTTAPPNGGGATGTTTKNGSGTSPPTVAPDSPSTTANDPSNSGGSAPAGPIDPAQSNGGTSYISTGPPNVLANDPTQVPIGGAHTSGKGAIRFSTASDGSVHTITAGGGDVGGDGSSGGNSGDNGGNGAATASPGIIAVAVVVVLLGIGLTAFIIIARRRRRRSAEALEESVMSEHGPGLMRSASNASSFVSGGHALHESEEGHDGLVDGAGSAYAYGATSSLTRSSTMTSLTSAPTLSHAHSANFGLPPPMPVFQRDQSPTAPAGDRSSYPYSISLDPFNLPRDGATEVRAAGVDVDAEENADARSSLTTDYGTVVPTHHATAVDALRVSSGHTSITAVTVTTDSDSRPASNLSVYHTANSHGHESIVRDLRSRSTTTPTASFHSISSSVEEQRVLDGLIAYDHTDLTNGGGSGRVLFDVPPTPFAPTGNYTSNPFADPAQDPFTNPRPDTHSTSATRLAAPFMTDDVPSPSAASFALSAVPSNTPPSSSHGPAQSGRPYASTPSPAPSSINPFADDSAVETQPGLTRGDSVTSHNPASPTLVASFPDPPEWNISTLTPGSPQVSRNREDDPSEPPTPTTSQPMLPSTKMPKERHGYGAVSPPPTGASVKSNATSVPSRRSIITLDEETEEQQERALFFGGTGAPHSVG